MKEVYSSWSFRGVCVWPVSKGLPCKRCPCSSWTIRAYYPQSGDIFLKFYTWKYCAGTLVPGSSCWNAGWVPEFLKRLFVPLGKFLRWKHHTIQPLCSNTLPSSCWGPLNKDDCISYCLRVASALLWVPFKGPITETGVGEYKTGLQCS